MSPAVEASARRRRTVAIAGAVATLVSGCAPAPAADVAVIEIGPPPAPVVVALAPGEAPSRARGRAVAWTADLKAARDRADREGRPLLILAVAEWSVASRALEEGPLADHDVVAASRVAVAVRLDLTDTEATADQAASLAVRSVPAVFVLGPGGEPRFRHEGTGLDPDALVAALLAE